MCSSLRRRDGSRYLVRFSWAWAPAAENDSTVLATSLLFSLSLLFVQLQADPVNIRSTVGVGALTIEYYCSNIEFTPIVTTIF